MSDPSFNVWTTCRSVQQRCPQTSTWCRGSSLPHSFHWELLIIMSSIHGEDNLYNEGLYRRIFGVSVIQWVKDCPYTLTESTHQDRVLTRTPTPVLQWTSVDFRTESDLPDGDSTEGVYWRPSESRGGLSREVVRRVGRSPVPYPKDVSLPSLSLSLVRPSTLWTLSGWEVSVCGSKDTTRSTIFV